MKTLPPTIRLLTTLLTTTFYLSAVSAQSTSWTGPATGAWSNAANWSNGVPQPGIIALFNVPGTYSIAVDTNATFHGLYSTFPTVNATFTPTGGPRSFSLTSNLSVTAGSNLAFTGPLTVQALSSNLEVNSISTLLLTGGSTMTFRDFYIHGNQAQSPHLIVDGPGTSLKSVGASLPTAIYVGTFANETGLLTVKNGALLDFDNIAHSTMHLGGVFSNTTGVAHVQSGAIVNAGVIRIGAPTSASNTNCSGTLNLSGSQSQIIQSGNSALFVGGSSNNNVGVFNISDGTFTSGTVLTTIGALGQVNFSGGNYVANGAMSILGKFNHTGGTFSQAAGLAIDITGGGDWVGTGGASYMSAANSALNVTGAGSSFSTISAVISDNSSVEVELGASFSAQSLELGATGTNYFTVDNSTIQVTGPLATRIGSGGSSQLHLQNNSVGSFQGGLDIAPTAVASSSFALVIGNSQIQSLGSTDVATTNGAANGALLASGSGAVITQTPGSNLTIGASSGTGSGQVNILSGAIFTSGRDGTVTINKNGFGKVTSATWNQFGSLHVKGVFEVDSGAVYNQLSNLPIHISNGGLFKNLNAMTLADGHSVIVTGSTSKLLANSLSLESGSMLTLNGGEATSQFLFNGGNVTFNSGTLNHTTSLTADGGTIAALLGPTATLGNGRNLIVSGTTQLQSGMILGGGKLTTVNLTGGNHLSLQSGTLQISGSTLTVGSSGQFGNLLVVNSGMTVETINGNAATIQNDGRAVVNGGTLKSIGSLTNHGEIELTSNLSTLGASLVVNNGTITGRGRIESSLLNNSSGIVHVHGGDRLVFNGSLHNNAGHLDVTSGGRLEFRQLVNNFSGGFITGQNAVMRFDAGVDNFGSIGLSYGTSDFFGDIVNKPGGNIQISGGGQVTFYEDIVQNGTMQVAKVGNTSSTAVIFGSFSGAGGFTGGGDVFALGDLRPGNSPASVLYGGNMFFGDSTHTYIELGGLAPGQFDQLLVTGDLGLDGNLHVSLIQGHSLKANEQYLIADIGGLLAGTFNGLGEGALVGNYGGRDLFISYQAGNGNDIALFTSVPEPSALVLILSLGCVATCLVRRTRGK